MTTSFSDHAARIRNEEARQMFRDLKIAILDMMPSKIRCTKEHVVFYAAKEFCLMFAQKNDFAVDLRLEAGRPLRDSRKWLNVFNVRKPWANVKRVSSEKKDLDYILYLVLQAYARTQSSTDRNG